MSNVSPDAPQKESELIYGLDSQPPFGPSRLAALQHILAMVLSVMAPPAIVAGALGVPPEEVFKTLVVRGDKTGVLEACIPGAAELNLKELAAVSGNKHVELVPLKEVLPLTGYIRGGCSPLAGKKHYPVYVDESAILQERIFVSAGHRGVQLRLAPDELLRAVEGTYAAIARY